MPIQNDKVYLDNSMARELSCSTRGYLKCILNLVPIEDDMSAAHVGSAIHAGIETYLKGGTIDESLQAYSDTYDELIPLEEEYISNNKFEWSKLTKFSVKRP